MIVRQTTDQDLDSIISVHQGAFGQDDEARLTADLLNDPSAAPRLSLMAVVDGRPAGHVLFTRAVVSGETAGIAASILAPLAVIPEFQGRGRGSQLVRNGLRQLAGVDTGLVFVLGHPGYYTRFGFRPAGACGLVAPYPIPPQHADAWMVLELQGGTIGTVEGRVNCANALDKREYWVE